MYSIGQFSKLTKTTIAALRFYDKTGLLKPEYTDENSGYRYYSSSQLNDLQKIISLRQIGMPIESIKECINSDDERSFLLERQSELNRQINEMQTQLKKLGVMLNGENKYEVIVKELTSCIVYSKTQKVRSNRDLYEFIQTTEKTIFDANPGLKRADVDYCFLTYLDNEYRSENMTVEYCQATNFRGKDTDGIVFRELPGCKVASLYFKGSNQYIGAGFAYLYDWINKTGLEPCGPPRESYIDGLWNVDDIDLWLTEIQVPVKATPHN